MKMRISCKYINLILFLIFGINAQAQKHQKRFDAIDVINYKFELKLTDSSDYIEGTAKVKIKFKKEVSSFQLDLVKKQENTKGMQVSAVLENGKEISYKHENEILTLNITTTKADEVRTFQIVYKGIPADGLIISKNKYNERTFFGDNWPDRGKNWLPVVDHPSDKATVDWIIIAPSHYQTIGNGVKVEETNISDNQTLTHWKMTHPIPPKVMVIGAARFAVESQDHIYGVPISSWVYPQDRDKGFSDYGLATPIMDYFINHVGPYPFKKLANVQSKTRFGGMENAGNIFYAEGSVTGTGSSEALIAHEVAHQWFGNSASELNWHHIWLSEGFATYFTNLYFEHKYGREIMVKREKGQRKKIIEYARQNEAPIVNTSIENYMQLLNPNSYEKGGWILHMLRREIGDQLFWEGIKAYYRQYKYSNAISKDLQKIMETVSGKNLSLFFDQWLYKTGHPKLNISWSSGSLLKIKIDQKQKNTVFNFPLDIKIIYEDASTSLETIQVSEKRQEIKIPNTKSITSIEIDPDTWLLFELLSLKEN